MLEYIKKNIKKFLIVICLIEIIFFISLQLLAYYNLDSVNSDNINRVLQDNRNLLLIGITGSVFLILTLSVYYYFTLLRPLKYLSAKVNSIAEKDVTSFSRSLFEMAQGNLTTTISIDTDVINSKVNGTVGAMTKGLNSIIVNLSEASKEFNSATDLPCKRLFYVGADSYLEGRICGEAMGNTLGGAGKVAIIVEMFGSIGQELRRKGFQAILNEKYPSINICGVIEAHSFELGYSKTQDLINRIKDLDGIYITHFGGDAVGKAVVDMNMKGRIKIICHDLAEGTMNYIQEGVITATISQDVFAQGHDPVINIFNNLAAYWEPAHERLLTNMEMITKENFSKFWRNGKGLIESDEVAATRSNPLKVSGKHVRIAVIGREGNQFWDGLKWGVDTAAKKLASYNAEVDWIIPKGFHSNQKVLNLSAEVYGTAINECIEKNYNAICVGIFDKNLVRYINDAVDKGIVVATFNSEPMSLRGLLKTLTKRTQRISEFSNNLSKAAEHTADSSDYNAKTIQYMAQSLTDESNSINNATTNMNQIAASIHDIARDSHDQKIAADHVAQSAYEISYAMESAGESVSEVVKSASESIEIAKEGSITVKQNLDQMKTIEETVNLFALKIQGMAKQSEQIEEIIQTIEDIAEQTNLLALNAAIEAARAGEYGRGFAVVADEVRNLAERSAAATKQTSSLINKVQKDMSEASTSIQMVVDKVRKGSDIATQSGQKIDKLMDSSQHMNKQIEVMSSANKSVTKSMSTLLSSINKISAVIDQNMSATEELSMGVKHTVEMISNIATISEFNATTINEISEKSTKARDEAKELGEVAIELTAVANELKSATAQFKIDSDTLSLN